MTEDFIDENDYSEDFAKIVKSKEYKKIKRSLLKQLIANNVAKDVFEDLVNDYMKLYVIKELLISDIQKTGVSVSYRNRNGYTTPKSNTSIADFNKVNLQMIKVLDKLNLEPVIEEDEDDEL